MPLAVVVDRATASAAEIVAAALHDHKRAAIVGSRTFGKASIQAVVPARRRRWRVKLTIATYRTPNGARPARPWRAPGRAGAHALMVRRRRGGARCLVSDRRRAAARRLRRASAVGASSSRSRSSTRAAARARPSLGPRRRAGRARRRRGGAAERGSSSGSAARRHRCCCAALLVERGVARAFPRTRCDEARRASAASPTASTRAADLRDLDAVTVDPPDARDFDDAISVAREGDGVRVYVHIADVAVHVRRDGALDREAARRALSVYVPGQVEPMLPHELSTGVCACAGEVATGVRDGRGARRRRTARRAAFPAQPDPLPTRVSTTTRPTRSSTGAPAHAEAASCCARPIVSPRDLRARRFARGALAIGRASSPSSSPTVGSRARAGRRSRARTRWSRSS